MSYIKAAFRRTVYSVCISGALVLSASWGLNTLRGFAPADTQNRLVEAMADRKPFIDRLREETNYPLLTTSLSRVRDEVTHYSDSGNLRSMVAMLPGVTYGEMMAVALQRAVGGHVDVDPRFRRLMVDKLGMSPNLPSGAMASLGELGDLLNRPSRSLINTMQAVFPIFNNITEWNYAPFIEKFNEKIKTDAEFKNNEKFFEAAVAGLAALNPNKSGNYQADHEDQILEILKSPELFARTGPGVGVPDRNERRIINEPGFRSDPQGNPLSDSSTVEKLFMRQMGVVNPDVRSGRPTPYPNNSSVSPEVFKKMDDVRIHQHACPGSVEVGGESMLPKTAEERRNTPAADIQRDPRLGQFKPCN